MRSNPNFGSFELDRIVLLPRVVVPDLRRGEDYLLLHTEDRTALPFTFVPIGNSLGQHFPHCQNSVDA